MTTPTVNPELIALLIRQASAWTGFRPDAILRHAVAEVALARLRGHTEIQLQQAIEASEATLVHDVCQAVSVGETYFFRHPEQFQLLLRELSSRFGRESRWRAWSAGCATGEEAYSLAALLRDREGKQIEVLGTDLVGRNVEAARGGTYGSWSVRSVEPLAPTFHKSADGRLEVNAELRPLVTFAEHNLLGPLPEIHGKFQVIFCRNVLVYFGRAAAAKVIAHLAAALADGGLLLFGTMDIAEPPVGLRRAGPAELQMYERHSAPAPIKLTVPTPSPISAPPHRAPRPRPEPPMPSPSPPSAPPGIAMMRVMSDQTPIAEPVAIHLRALALIEAGDLDVADKVLEALSKRVNDYLPAHLERALLHLRLGERGSGLELMRTVLKQCQDRPGDEVLAAPEPMTVAFVKASAQASLRGVT